MSRAQSSLPLPAGTWEIDPAHSNVEFVVRHVFTSMRGRFAAFRGTITVGDDLQASSFTGSIDAQSIDTGLAARDEHLRSADFFDAAAHPSLDFATTAVAQTDDGRYRVDGELTIRGVTRPVALDVEFLGAAKDPWGGTRAGFTARGEVNREDFGMTWNQLLEAGGVMLGRKVRIELEGEAVLTAGRAQEVA